MSKKADPKQEYQKKVEETKKKLDKAISEWTEEDVQEHLIKAASIYHNQNYGRRLGNFSWDTENRYHWHVYDDFNNFKLSRRLKLGWTFARLEDAKRAGLTDESLSATTIDGETCVEMSHKNQRAVLLKIPRQLWEINQRAKQIARENRPLVDADGNPVQIKETRGTDNAGHGFVVQHEESPMLIPK